MRFKFGKRKKEWINHKVFTWRPVIARDKEGNKYIVWLEWVFKTKTTHFNTSFYTYYVLESNSKKVVRQIWAG